LRTIYKKNILSRRSELFFIFSGEEAGPLWNSYLNLATKHQPHEFFYHVTADLGEKVRQLLENSFLRNVSPLWLFINKFLNINRNITELRSIRSMLF